MLKPSHTARLRFRRFSVRLPRELGKGGPYFAMILINALGYGLFAPFSILYFHQVVGLSQPLVGLGLSIATGVGLVATPLGGPLIDRFGARLVAVVTNLLSAVGFAAYLSVHSFAGFLIVALFLAVSSSSGGTAGQALVVDLAAPEDRDRWYALVRMAFNAGAGVGALLAGVLVAVGGTSGYRWVVGLNGLSFALAAGLLFLVRVHRASVQRKPRAEPIARCCEIAPSGAHGSKRYPLDQCRSPRGGVAAVPDRHCPCACLDCWAVVRSQYGDDRGASDASRAGGDILAADAQHGCRRPWVQPVLSALCGCPVRAVGSGSTLSLRVYDPVHAG